eukprot:TRINITY_DN7230_c0_g1_i1.p1 TRINITY_DN7230_c0_g1~~TRINITY_DN7230_c0_g1_i1.p1  ORF type:complete len:148 (+),score=19.70 TRINITY_DN7230_c0_g1_i1:121-564(+)
MQPTISIKMGKSKLGLISEHWAIKVGDTWYELQGDNKKSSGSPNIINSHQDDSKYTSIKDMAHIDASKEEEILEWMQEWVKERGTYHWTGDNCQMLVSHLVYHFLGVRIPTQNAEIGNGFIIGGIALAAIGALTALGGAFVRGKHTN